MTFLLAALTGCAGSTPAARWASRKNHGSGRVFTSTIAPSSDRSRYDDAPTSESRVNSVAPTSTPACAAALFLDGDGFVLECTGENVFLVKDGVLTAVEHPDALPGITRQTLLDLTGAASRPVHLHELRDADEIFLTGTSAEVSAVGQLDGRFFQAGPVTLELQARYQRIVHGEAETARGWLTRLEVPVQAGGRP